jgi:DNA-directed RNA polymerase sigma subunit (sigma70/sigma32)
VSKKLSSKVIGAEMKRRNKEKDSILAALESNEIKPVCGLSGCAYRIGWAKAQAKWESDTAEREKERCYAELERMAAYCDSVPAFARSVLRYRIGEGREKARTISETAAALGIHAEQVKYILKEAIEITKAVKIHAKWKIDHIQALERQIAAANKHAADQVAWDISNDLMTEMERGNSN